jgi:hypothetical protein
MSSLEHLFCVLGITDEDNQVWTTSYFNFVRDPYILAAMCISPDFVLGLKILKIDDFGLDSVCSIGGLLLMVIFKGVVEGRFVYTMLSQGVKWVRRRKENRKGRNVDGTSDEQTEKEALAEV